MHARELSDESERDVGLGFPIRDGGNEGPEPQNLHKDVYDAPLSIGTADCLVARDDRLSIVGQFES